MANEEHLKILKRGVEQWNKWRSENCTLENPIRVDLSFADLRDANLRGVELPSVELFGVNLGGADLSAADLNSCNLTDAQLSGANLSKASLHDADLRGADLSGATLIDADLRRVNLSNGHLSGAKLANVDLEGANLSDVDLSNAHLNGADLTDVNLQGANLTSADLTDADLSCTDLVETDFTNATITGCRIYGVSAWNVTLVGTVQHNLVITKQGEPVVTVDNLEVGQFIYLMLNNTKIRNVIDTIGKKGVLILGRFTEARKAVLDALKERLRHFDLVPMVFDWDKPTRRDLTETVQLLANMSRFVVADVTDAKSIPQELSHIVPFLPSVPVCPIILAGQLEYSMFEHWRGYSTMLPVIEYHDQKQLVGNIEQQLLARVEEWEAGYDKTKALEKASREKDEALREKDRQLAALLAENNELKKQL